MPDDTSPSPEEKEDLRGHVQSTGEEQTSQNEQAERPPDSLHRRIQEVTGVGGWEYDPDTDTVTGTSGLHQLLEIPEEKDLDLETALSFHPPDARGQIEGAIRKCLDEGTPFDEEVPLITAKGTRRWVRVRGELHHWDGDGRRLTGTVQDISKRKEIEDNRRSEQEALRRTYRIMADRDLSLEEKTGRLIDLGREYLDLSYGFLTRVDDNAQRIVDARGTHPLLQPGASCPLSKSYCRHTLEEGRLYAVQDAPSDGWADDPAFETFALGAYIGATIFGQDEPYGTLCFASHRARERPFTENEEMFVEVLAHWLSYELGREENTERLEAQNERLDRLASVVSHDLRNPLSVATGRMELVEREVDRGTGEHLAAVNRALGRMDRIIDDMMALTWSGEAFGEAEMSGELRLEALAESSWEQVDTEAATLRVEEDLALRAHEGRLRQLLENLFRNAVEHGGSDVTVWVGPLLDGFYVEDDGPGIPEEHQDQVFDARYTTGDEGTGLGLSIVETVVDAHGWSVTLSVGPRGGARFEFAGGSPDKEEEDPSSSAKNGAPDKDD